MEYMRQVEALFPSSDEEGEGEPAGKRQKKQREEDKASLLGASALPHMLLLQPLRPGEELCSSAKNEEAPAARLVVSTRTGEGMAGKVLKGLTVGIVEGGRDMGKVRAKVLSEVVRRNGGTLASSLQSATHLVSSYRTRNALKAALNTQHIPDTVVLCLPEWVPASVAAGRPVEAHRIPNDVAVESLLPPPPQPQLPPASPQHETDPDAVAGYIPVFFPEKSRGLEDGEEEEEYFPLSFAGAMNPDVVAWLEGKREAPSRGARIGWVCQRGTEESASNGNEALIAALQELADVYERTGDQWRKYTAGKAVGILKRWGSRITSAAQLQGVRGIGGRTLEKIREILSTGSCTRLSELKGSEEVQCLTVFGRIWGVGPATAAKLYHGKEIRSLKELQERSAADPSLLNAAQRVGLKYYDELQERIPRSEVDWMRRQVADAALRINPFLHVEVCGSYRRGKATCGDVDVLICDKQGSDRRQVLNRLIDSLTEIGFLTDSLGGRHASSSKSSEDTHDAFYGICQVPSCKGSTSPCSLVHLDAICPRNTPEGSLPPPEDMSTTHVHRRIDLKIYAKEVYPFALLYFTGSDYFNRSMRLYCQKKGYSLSDRSLTPVIRVNKEKVHKGDPIPCDTEREIFEAVGLQYKTPQERDV